MITLDGFFEGPNREIDWHVVDDEFNEYALGFLKTVDTLIFGRVTYELMASYWPTGRAITDDPLIAERMNHISKIVFSKTLEKVDWENTRLVKIDAAGEIARLRLQPGKNMAIFGSAELAATLIKKDLIDEYRIFINPIVLGEGISLFKGVTKRLKLKLLHTRVFHSGVVLLSYQPEEKGTRPAEKLTPGKTIVTAEPGKQEVTISRVFAAPSELVFKAYTDPLLIPQWWGPKKYTTTVNKMDVRPGGAWRFVQHSAEGKQYGFHGFYHEILPSERLVYTFEYEGRPGRGLLEMVTLEEHEGMTKLIDKSVFQCVDDRDEMFKSGMEEGATESMDRLAELLLKV